MNTLHRLEDRSISQVWEPRSAYDRAACGYDEWPWQKVWRSVEGRDVEDIVRGRKIGSVLDVGCGTGTLLKKLSLLSDGGAELVGLDISARMLEQARLKTRGIPIRFIENDLLRCTLQENYYDFVFMCRVASHLLDLKPHFSKISKILKPAGTFVLSDVHSEFPYEYTRLPFEGRKIRVTTYKHSFEEITAICEEFSLEISTFRTYSTDVLSNDLRNSPELPTSLRRLLLNGSSTKFGFFAAFRRRQIYRT